VDALENFRATHGRVRGFAEWRPHGATGTLLHAVGNILDEYQAHLPLTLRQIFYRLVAMHGFEKTEKSYKRLCEILNRARRAGAVAFDAIRDDGFHKSGFLGWNDVEHFVYNVRRDVDEFTLDRQNDQGERLALWCEATGMVPQLEAVSKQYSVPVYSSGGFDSLTVKHDLAKEFAELDAVTILHVGDHDPSGVHVALSLDEDVRAFLDELGGEATFERLAVTPAQIAAHRLPTAPPKVTDRRCFQGQTVQAEALPPDLLARIVEDAIREHIDWDIYAETLERERDERARIRAQFFPDKPGVT